MTDHSELIARLEDAAADCVVDDAGATAVLFREAAAALRELDEQNAEFLDQARQGLMIDHDCPAVYACAYILGQLTPESDQVDGVMEPKFTDGRGNDISHLVDEKP